MQIEISTLPESVKQWIETANVGEPLVFTKQGQVINCATIKPVQQSIEEPQSKHNHADNSQKKRTLYDVFADYEGDDIDIDFQAGRKDNLSPLFEFD